MQVLSERDYQFITYLFDKPDTHDIHQVLSRSEPKEDYYNGGIKLTLLCDPETYRKYADLEYEVRMALFEKLKKFENGFFVQAIELYPDLQKFQILDNKYQTIITPWEDINRDQELLLNQLKAAISTLEFQNIGNTCRTILQKIATHLFDKNLHTAPLGIDLSAGKFKNRLHTIIKYTLKGLQLGELEKYAESQIETAERSVDLANTLTHDLRAHKAMAELCVISVLSVVSVMKVINGLKE